MKTKLFALSLAATLFFVQHTALASHISGIRLTQTGNVGLQLNVDVTAFYTTGSTETTANLGTYYNQIPALSWGDGNTVARYGVGPSTGIPLVATSTVVNGVAARSYRGSFSHTYGNPGSYTVSANTSCCPQTTPTYTLVTGRLEVTTVSTTGPFGPTTFTTSYLRNDILVDAFPPELDVAFAPATINEGQTSTLTLTFDQTGSTVDAAGIVVSHGLPSGVVVAASPNINNTCAMGTLTATPGSATILFENGVLGAGATCSVSFDVVANQAGVHRFGPAARDSIASDFIRLNESLSPSQVAEGQIALATFTLDNSENSQGTALLGFTKTLPPNLQIADPPVAATTCPSGIVTATVMGTTIQLSGAVMGSRQSCVVTANVTGVGLPSVDTTVNQDALEFADVSIGTSLGGGSISPGSSERMGMTLTNSGSLTQMNAAFSHALPPGLVVAATPIVRNNCGGTFTATPGSGTIDLVGGLVRGNTECDISLRIEPNYPAAVDTTMSAGSVMSSFAPTTSVFAPTTVMNGSTSTLTVTFDNSANGTPGTNLDMTYTLPTNVVVAGTPSSATTCTGGTVTAVAGSSSITYNGGGSVPASMTCTVSADVTVPNASTTGNVVTAPNVAISSAISPSTVTTGGGSVLTITIDNTAGTAAEPIVVEDELPSGVAIATTPNAATTCTGGTLTAEAGTRGVVYGGGVVASGATCTVTVDVDTAVDTDTNPGSINAPFADVSTNLTRRYFAPGEIGQIEVLVEGTNRSNTSDVPDFTYNVPSGLMIASTPNATSNCSGGSVTAVAGANTFTSTGGTVNVGASCTISVDLEAPMPGPYVDTLGGLNSDLGPNALTSGTLTVTGSPNFLANFSPGQLSVGSIATLTLSLNNSMNTSAAGSASFSGTLPMGIVVATPANAVTTCPSGMLTANEGATTFSFADGSIPAGSLCTVSLDVTPTAGGMYSFDAGVLTTALGDSVSGAATAMLTATAPPTFAMAFNPSSISVGAISTLSYTIDNSANTVSADGLTFTDELPLGLRVANMPNVMNSCAGGLLSAAAGTTQIDFSLGSVSAGATCFISVDVTASASGTLNNDAGVLDSSLGTTASGTAIATLSVTGAPMFTKAFGPSAIEIGETSTLTFTVNNAGGGSDVTGLAFSDALPSGVVVASPPATVDSCGGTVAASPGAAQITYSGGSVGMDETCTVTVDVVASSAGSKDNDAGILTSSAGDSEPGTATATLIVTVPTDDGDVTSGGDDEEDDEGDGCATTKSNNVSLWLFVLGGLGLARRRRYIAPISMY